MSRCFVVTNSGKRVTDDEASKMIAASAYALSAFCSAWGLVVPSLRYSADGSGIADTEDVIDLADQPPTDESGVLGEHTELSGQVRGTVYAGYELDNGGKVLSLDGTEAPGTTTVSAIFFHELVEQLVDPTVNAWWDGPVTAGNIIWDSVAAEVADPVEDGFVKVILDDGTSVWLSNYILPAWLDSQSRQGPYDALATLPSPFTFSGYVVVRNEPGSETPVFPARYPDHRSKLKEWIWKSRFARRKSD